MQGLFIALYFLLAANSAPEIKIDNFKFQPEEVRVHVGTPVKWVNQDDITHSIVGPEQLFKSKLIDGGDSFSFTFAKPGTYLYFCGLHPKDLARNNFPDSPYPLSNND